MKKQTFYRKDSLQRTRVWTIEVKKVNDGLSNIITEDGLIDGKLKGSLTPITKGLGKKNIYEQAVADAESVINSKIKQGYGTDLNNLKGKGDTATIKAPMKGDTYNPSPKTDKDAKRSYTLDRAGIRGQVIGIERKLDGHRYRIVVNKKSVTFYSSSGDVVPTFPHIEKSIRESYDRIKPAQSELILDGEIYNHKLGFYLVASACGSKVNMTEEKLALRAKMQFHIFDVCLDEPLQRRKDVIADFVDNVNVMPVNIFYVKASEKMIDTYFESFLAEGYEGAMIRCKFDLPYEYKRSHQLLKYKPEEDGEFKIVGFNRSITGETLGSFQCVMDNGKTFSANPKDEFGTDAIKKEIWENQKRYLNKWVTVLFMGLGPDDGLPRYPRAKGFRKGKSQD